MDDATLARDYHRPMCSAHDPEHHRRVGFEPCDCGLMELIVRVREDQALRDASAACMYCGGRAMPDDPRCHVAHGPNAAGNYFHKPSNDQKALCAATSIHHELRAIRARDVEGE